MGPEGSTTWTWKSSRATQLCCMGHQRYVPIPHRTVCWIQRRGDRGCVLKNSTRSSVVYEPQNTVCSNRSSCSVYKTFAVLFLRKYANTNICNTVCSNKSYFSLYNTLAVLLLKICTRQSIHFTDPISICQANS